MRRSRAAYAAIPLPCRPLRQATQPACELNSNRFRRPYAPSVHTQIININSEFIGYRLLYNLNVRLYHPRPHNVRRGFRVACRCSLISCSISSMNALSPIAFGIQRIPKLAEETLAIRIPREDTLSPDPTRGDVMLGSRILFSQLPRHAEAYPRCRHPSNANFILEA